MKTFTCKLLFLLPIIAYGEPYSTESLTVNGETYKNATVKLSTPSLATITHAEGIKKIDPSQLDQTIAEKIGFSKKEAIEFENKKKEASKQIAIAKKNAPNKTYRYKVSENLEDGLIVNIYTAQTSTRFIGGSQSRTGGGGGISVTSTDWEWNYKQAFIPHTAKTQPLPEGAYFEAKIRDNGETRRIWETTVLAVHNLHSFTILEK